VTLPVTLGFYAAALLAISTVLTLDAGAQVFVARLARTLIIVAIAIALYRALEIFGFSRARLYALTGINIEESLLPFVRVGLELLIIAFTVVIVVQEWGYDVSALVAGLGLGGLAVSLAAADTIANIFGFSMIVGDRPFIVGDYIKTNDVEGTVEKVGLRSTRIRQPDQALVTVPNKTLANAVILNWSRPRRARRRSSNSSPIFAPCSKSARVSRRTPSSSISQASAMHGSKSSSAAMC
jgi:MscS family membrane protein